MTDINNFLDQIRNKDALTADENLKLFRLKSNYPEVRGLLIEKNLKIVHFLAHSYTDRGVPYEDLVSAGTIGLIEAIDKFNPEMNTKFTTFAFPYIRNEISDEIAKIGKSVAFKKSTLHRMQAIFYWNKKGLSIEEIAKKIKASETVVKRLLKFEDGTLSLDYISENENGVEYSNSVKKSSIDNNTLTPEEEVLRKELADNIYEVLNTLPDMDRKIIIFSYGLFGNRTYKIRELADMFNVSISTIMSRKTSALLTLRKNKIIRDLNN